MISEQMTQLKHLMRTHSDPRLRQRAHAVLLVGEGRSVREVARWFATATHCVRSWRDRFCAEGAVGLQDRARRGCPPKLDAAARQFLVETVERSPGDFGLPMTVWTLPDLQRLLAQARQIQVSLATIRRALHAAGFGYRRPRHDLTHRQDKEAVASTKQVLSWLEKKSLAPTERLHLVFVDECEVHAHPGLAKIWQRRGQPVKVPAAGEDHKFVLFGALDYASGRVFWQRSAQKNSEAFGQFLEMLATAFPGEVVLIVLDNVSYHKSRVVQEQWHRLAAHVTPYWLPVYASQLNLIERVWRWLQSKLANHRWWNDMARLQAATETLLTALEVHFHTTNGPSFQVVQNFCHSA